LLKCNNFQELFPCSVFHRLTCTEKYFGDVVSVAVSLCSETWL